MSGAATAFDKALFERLYMCRAGRRMATNRSKRAIPPHAWSDTTHTYYIVRCCVLSTGEETGIRAQGDTASGARAAQTVPEHM
eukprot:1457427-Heterocapsa_arctica.AAC.1